MINSPVDSFSRKIAPKSIKALKYFPCWCPAVNTRVLPTYHVISRNLYITFLGDVVSLRSLLDLKAPPESKHESRLASLPLNPTEAAALLQSSELTGRISIPVPSSGRGNVASDQIFYLKNDALSIEDFVEVYTIYKCKACDFSSCQKGKQLHYIQIFYLLLHFFFTLISRSKDTKVASAELRNEQHCVWDWLS